MQSIAEADWKVFRKLHPVLVNRYCQHVLQEIENIGKEDEKSPHERYLAIYQAIQKHDREIELLFNNPRRSSAIMQIMAIQSRGLLMEEERSLFSNHIKDILSTLKI